MLWALPASAVSAQEITIQHKQGETVLAETPKRVLVQDIALIDILDALGVEITGVPGGDHLYPDYLKQYTSKDYIKTGTLQEPNYEAIAAARADLMIIASRSAVKYKELSRIQPTIDLTPDNLHFLPSIQQNITTLGEIFAKQERAAELNASIDARFEALREAAATVDNKAIVLVTNAGKLGVYGPKSRVSWIFNEVGFTPVIDNIDDRFHGGDSVSYEFILESNPDWLFVIDRDAGIGQSGAAAKLLDNPLIHETTAWKKQQIVYLSPVDAYTIMHGYRSVMNLSEQVLSALNSAN